jgi:hypothetical protein
MTVSYLLVTDASTAPRFTNLGPRFPASGPTHVPNTSAHTTRGKRARPRAAQAIAVDSALGECGSGSNAVDAARCDGQSGGASGVRVLRWLTC